MINKVVENNLCCYCGICYGVCPQGAIKYEKIQGRYLFSVSDEKCDRCAKCITACPGVGSNFSSEFIGNYRECYLGRMSPDHLIKGVSSGGCATGILCGLLEKKKIDYVIVVKDVLEDPLSLSVCITSKITDVLLSRGSKYQNVPLGIFIKDILKINGRYAVVGLPCHIQGIRKAMDLFPSLRERIFLIIGLFCGQSVSDGGMILLFRFLGLKTKEIKQISFRKGKWPGKISILTKTGKIYEVDYLKYISIFNMGLFVPPRCFTCSDFTSELADISLGEFWSKENIKKNVGQNIIIVRNKKGEDCLNVIRKKIILKKVSSEEVINNQFFRFYSKKNYPVILKNLSKKLNFSFPDFSENVYKVSPTRINKAKKLYFDFSYRLFFFNSYITFKFSEQCLKIWPFFYLYWKFFWYCNRFTSFMTRFIFKK